VARAAAARLAETATPVVLLELDQMRVVVTPHPTGSETELDTVYRSLVFMARSLTEAGLPVIIDATAHHRAWRNLARASILRFAEVQIQHPVDVARTGGGPAVNAPYEAAVSPELTIDVGPKDADAAGARVAALGLTLGPAIRRPQTGAGAVIWLTGPPGSGKTTLACRLTERLTAEGMAVAVLEWVALRALALRGAWATDRDEDIAHRALAYTAKQLADAGLVVVVDATAPRRAWRALAREIVRDFAEVQLVCPAEVCLDRERTVRWRPHGATGTAAPDLAIEYEYSLNPDLLLDTEKRSEWTAADDLVGFARRLLMRPSIP
jgi:adenylylsulfate kinase